MTAEGRVTAAEIDMACRTALAYLRHTVRCAHLHKDSGGQPTGYTLRTPCDCGRDQAIEAMVEVLAQLGASIDSDNLRHWHDQNGNLLRATYPGASGDD